MPTQEFHVKFEGVKLPAEAVKRIQSSIQQLVIHELSGIDHKGDLVVNRPIKIGPLINGIIARLAAGQIHIVGINR